MRWCRIIRHCASRRIDAFFAAFACRVACTRFYTRTLVFVALYFIFIAIAALHSTGADRRTVAIGSAPIARARALARPRFCAGRHLLIFGVATPTAIGPRRTPFASRAVAVVGAIFFFVAARFHTFPFAVPITLAECTECAFRLSMVAAPEPHVARIIIPPRVIADLVVIVEHTI